MALDEGGSAGPDDAIERGLDRAGIPPSARRTIHEAIRLMVDDGAVDEIEALARLRWMAKREDRGLEEVAAELVADHAAGRMARRCHHCDVLVEPTDAVGAAAVPDVPLGPGGGPGPSGAAITWFCSEAHRAPYLDTGWQAWPSGSGGDPRRRAAARTRR